MASVDYEIAPRRGLLEAVYHSIADLGAAVLNTFETLGDMTLFAWRTLVWMCTRLPRRETLYSSMYQIGVLSLPVVALTGTFIGMVLAVQSYTQFRAFGLETQLGGVINKSMFRELGPVLAATMLAGRVGSAMAAELGTMRVTEQIDALSSMGANPIQHLVVPRFLSCLLLIPSLTIMAVFMGVVGGTGYCIFVLDIDIQHYTSNANDFVENWDLFYGIVKSVFFGATIGLVSCYRGFHCKPGAEGVGSAATTAFVQSFVVIIVLDLFLSIFLDTIYLAIWPEGPSLF
ncbi:MAG: ABC transporter permease [Planctomycetes bacterium]|nr:ABC transporter permease [Planctomycetota bacterium]